MDTETRKLIAETTIAEATSFYKLVVGTSTLFLGGTLVFWEKVTPLLSTLSLVLLSVGWSCLIATVVLVVFVRRDNIEAGRLVLAEKYAEVDKPAVRSRKLTTWSGLCLAAGMFFVASAGMAGLMEKAMANSQKRFDTQNVETRSIPFKEIAQPVKEPAPAPVKTTETETKKD